MWSSTIWTMKRRLSIWGWFELVILRGMRRDFAIFMKMCLWIKYWSSFIIETVHSSFLNFNAINSCKCTVPRSTFLRRRVRIIQRKWFANLVVLVFKINTSVPSKTLVWFFKNACGEWYFPQKSLYIVYGRKGNNLVWKKGGDSEWRESLR